MTAPEIVARLMGSPKGITAARVQKAKALADRMGIAWVDVVTAMDPHERELLEAAK